MKFGTLLALGLCAVLTRISPRSNVVRAEAVQAPLKTRVSLNLWRKALKARDQEVLRVFKDLEVTFGDASKFTDVAVSLIPQDGDLDNFDFDITLAADNFGGESTKLAVKGEGSYDGAKFSFEGPVAKTALKYKMGTSPNTDFNYT